ncbi:MAG: 30S ribosome-binding factor RbfA [Clostridia bacterium]|nr:30S ribosome-binding factor RbfA [Clostridia bacterium]
MDRILRIAGEMQRALTEIINRDMKDPRIPPITSVTRVKLTKDLQFAKAYVSIFGSPEEKKQTVDCLNSSSGFIRSMLGKRMIIRQLPKILFKVDDSVDVGTAMDMRIDEIIAGDRKKAEESAENRKETD